MKYIPVILVCLGTFISLQGCGGGGSGGSGNSDITYDGNTNQAKITTTNASALVNTVVNNSSASRSIGSANRSSGDTNASLNSHQAPAVKLNQYLSDAIIPEISEFASRLEANSRQVDGSENCDSGSFDVTGDLENDGTGKLTANFKNCRFGDETLNGKITARIDAFDLNLLILIDATSSFSNLTLTNSSIDISVSGSIRTQATISSNLSRLTANMVSLDNNNSALSKLENLVIATTFNNIQFPSSFSETINGRIFDSINGFIDISTTTPLTFNTLSQRFPDSGQFLVSGEGSINVYSMSSDVARLELDIDGDNNYEITAVLNWLDLDEESGSNLADSDSDGMNDSWEQANGLDPENPLDATLDSDGDGVSNLDEYLAGSDPNNSGISPPNEADLKIVSVDSADPIVAGNNLSYILTLTNIGGVSASNIQVLNTLPTGSTYISATGDGWTCTHTSGTVTCTRNSLNVGETSTVTIDVTTPNISGTISNNASVSSSLLDPVSSNNSITETTVVTGGTDQVTEISLSANAIIYDSVRQKIYATVPSTAGAMGNSITTIDPLTPQIGSSVFIGSEPGPLSISDDASVLYVGLDGAASIRLFDVTSQTPGLEFTLGSDSTFGPFYAEDIETQPNSSSVVAVSLKNLGVSPRHAGVAIFENGIVRSTMTARHTGSNVIEFSSSESTLYGYNNETTEFGIRTMSVDTSGVTTDNVARNLISGFGIDFEFDNGRLYASNGTTVDASSLIIAGTFPASGLVESDSSVSRVFFLTGTGTNRTLEVYDLNTFLLQGSLAITGVNGNPKNLIRWGGNGLAFHTDQNEVFIIQTSLVP